MSNITLKDILITARQESYRMRHFYLGAEHIFIALLEVKGGLATSILEKHGLTPDYVIDAVRRKIGKGSRHRLWAGIPNTPRTDVILGIANDIALENGRKEIQERDLLIAILDENDNMPIRTLKALGLDISTLKKAGHTYAASPVGTQPFVKTDFGPDFERGETLTKDQLFLLRRMFHGYASIRIERRLLGGYTPALILIVTPIHADHREDAAVVVKIGSTDVILDEAQRYETHVKGRLPPLTTRLEDKPTAPETSDLAGIKYTLVADFTQTPHDLRSIAQKWSGDRLGRWLKEKLYPTFGRMWWQQSRPYRFEVWREYDWLLPPILTLELVDEKQVPPDPHILKFPIKRSRLNEIEYGDIVVVENFTVQKIDQERNTIQLAIGNTADVTRAYKIEIRGLDFTTDTYYRGEVVERIVGSVWKTRSEQLIHAARALEPDFDLDAEKIPFGETQIEKLPNPLVAYQELLETYVNGSLSTIHGDLHLGNILLGPDDSPSLIDFAHTRDGHTIFDWANLEISLLNDMVMTTTGDSWEDAYTVARHIASLNAPPPGHNPAVVNALQSVVILREIVGECLAVEDNWTEYFIALAACALRAMSWETLSIGCRRLMFLLAAIAMYELRKKSLLPGDVNTTTPDASDTEISKRQTLPSDALDVPPARENE